MKTLYLQDVVKFFVPDEPGLCWEWCGTRTKLGYGHFNSQHKTLMAHRAVWEFYKGPIPKGMHLDHLCYNPSCVNPGHLEPVTPAENSRRSRPAKRRRAQTHCKRGHLMLGDTLRVYRGRRYCRVCIYMLNKGYKEKDRGLKLASV